MDTTEAQPETGNVADIPVLDVSTLTLGEMSALEQDSGRDFAKLIMAGNATRKLVALWVHEYRNSERPRSWQELSELRAFARKS